MVSIIENTAPYADFQSVPYILAFMLPVVSSIDCGLDLKCL